MGVVIGVDIGQRVDPTAIAVAEYEDRAPPPTPARILVTGGRMTEQPAVYPQPDYHFLIRHLERLPLGTPYPQVAERVAAVARGVRERSGARPKVYLDEDANDTYGAFKVGTHDDLVTALGLAVQEVPRRWRAI
jgi:hypothetical protein